MNRIEIWQPRYRDRVVLIACHKVADGINDIVFTKAKELNGRVFRAEGDMIRSCPKDSNGKISCYAVPLDSLRLVDTERSLT